MTNTVPVSQSIDGLGGAVGESRVAPAPPTLEYVPKMRITSIVRMFSGASTLGEHVRLT